MRARSSAIADVFSFGGRVPPTVGALISAIVLASLVGVLTRGLGLVAWAALVPEEVWRGQLWRLVTWVFFDSSPFSLLFAAMTLYFFGRDLYQAWGARRFLGTFFGISAAAGVAVTLLARFAWPGLMMAVWLGPWPPLLALTVAWAMIFPERQLLFMMALPMTGRGLLWVTLGGTLLFAAFDGIAAHLPTVAAELLMLAYARGWSLRGFWQTMRIRQYERRARRRASHLKVVKKEDPPRWLN